MNEKTQAGERGAVGAFLRGEFDTPEYFVPHCRAMQRVQSVLQHIPGSAFYRQGQE